MRLRHHRHGHEVAFTGRRARSYATWASGPLRWAYRSLARDIDAAAPRGATLLDVGTGPGVLLRELARRRPDLKLIGVDLSPDMVAAAGRTLAGYPQATVHVGDVASLPLPDRSVDLVVSTLSSHHWADPAAAVSEMARVLRPGGRASIYDLRLAPFDELEAAGRSAFSGEAPARSPFRLGWLAWPRVVRLTFTS